MPRTKARKPTLRDEIAAQFRGHDPEKIAAAVRAGLGRPWLVSKALDGVPELPCAAAVDAARRKRDEAARVKLHGQEHADWSVTYYVIANHIRETF
jgi:hypothetical protein